MKTARLPLLRVEPELREAAEQVLEDGGSLSGFIEASVRETIERRRTCAEFRARGLVSGDPAQSSSVCFASEAVHDELGQMLSKARTRFDDR